MRVLSILLVLLSVAFFTLLERKIMSLVHLRLGPNKPGVLGFIVPLLDAFKLLTKTCYIPVSSNFYPYILAPGLSLSLSLFL
jgi:NADH-quinone oxidoreductase subunit H